MQKFAFFKCKYDCWDEKNTSDIFNNYVTVHPIGFQDPILKISSEKPANNFIITFQIENGDFNFLGFKFYSSILE